MSRWWWLLLLLPYAAWQVRGCVRNWQGQRTLTEARRREQTAQTRALQSAHAWAADPDGGGRFTGDRDAVLAHDPECRSLAEIWKPRKGGQTCFSDIHECNGDCETTFYVEGLASAFPDCPKSWHYYCACCLAKAKACPCETEDDDG
jgi:hypothetical protein